jgi:hypothetical protein
VEDGILIMKERKTKMKNPVDYNSCEYGKPGWWNLKASIAKKMTDAGLLYSIYDCSEAAKCIPQNEGKYMDEMSIYQMEINRRRTQA